MSDLSRRRLITGALALGGAAAALPARAEEAEVIDARVNLALEKLYKDVPGARDLASRSKAILVMPEVVKGGFLLAGSYGEGALRMNNGTYDRSTEYYSIGAASIGFQAGIQSTSHALFFLTDGALKQFRRADGWEVGVDAEVTFPDRGLNVGTTSTIADRPIIGIVFAEDGLLIGASLEGAKYSRINR